MAIDPYKMTNMGPRFFPNEETTLQRVSDPKAYFITGAERIIRGCPPSLPWASTLRGETYRGLFNGPTAIAYFFWTVHTRHPDLELEGKIPKAWCKAYLELGQESVSPLLGPTDSCGITNEYLSTNALKAILYQDKNHATKVLNALRNLEIDKSYCEWLKGRAGALYILRIIRTWLPSMSVAINEINIILIEEILSQQPWSWSGREYIAPVHGDFGILTQILLSCPSYAPKIEVKLRSLLNLQEENGNWPVIPGKDIGLVQFCHGAPGVLISLLAIRSFFPDMKNEIDRAVEKGRRCIWEKGLLCKEPNVCHGISGNAIALEREQRDHFLSLVTPELVQQGSEDGKWVMEECWTSLLWGEAGRAWIWMDVWDGGEGKCVLYSDV